MPNVLFIHQNFPGQFVHLASRLASHAEMQVAAIGADHASELPGIRLVKYRFSETDVPPGHALARQFNVDCLRGEQILYACLNLMASGFVPDIVYAHPGWGESLPLRSLFPDARILAYCEFYYRREGQDRNFDPEFPQTDIEARVTLHLRNASTLLALDDCDVGISPIRWQQQSFPSVFHPKIQVIYDGVDTDRLRPDEDAFLDLPLGRKLSTEDEIFTYATGSHEPLRGYHIFMRALPRILKERPNAHALIIGGQGTGYGFRAPPARDWKKVYYDPIASEIDTSRVHFLGQLPYADYVRALQISRAHVYLTYPFVMSWSLIEAISTGCLVIGSTTPPVREVIDGSNGLLVDFFDVRGLSDCVIEALAAPERFRKLRQSARDTAIERYDLKRVCLPALLQQMGIQLITY